MTKQELINTVSRRTGIEKVAVRAIIDESIATVRDSICNGEPVYIRGLFTLHNIKRAEKIGQIIAKRQSLVVPAHYTPHAKFCKELREEIKKLPIDKNV